MARGEDGGRRRRGFDGEKHSGAGVAFLEGSAVRYPVGCGCGGPRNQEAVSGDGSPPRRLISFLRHYLPVRWRSAPSAQSLSLPASSALLGSGALPAPVGRIGPSSPPSWPFPPWLETGVLEGPAQHTHTRTPPASLQSPKPNQKTPAGETKLGGGVGADPERQISDRTWEEEEIVDFFGQLWGRCG